MAHSCTSAHFRTLIAHPNVRFLCTAVLKRDAHHQHRHILERNLSLLPRPTINNSFMRTTSHLQVPPAKKVPIDDALADLEAAAVAAAAEGRQRGALGAARVWLGCHGPDGSYEFTAFRGVRDHSPSMPKPGACPSELPSTC